MDNAKSHSEPEPLGFCDAIGTCAVCGYWVHDAPPYLQRSDGYFVHRACERRVVPQRRSTMMWRTQPVPSSADSMSQCGLRGDRSSDCAAC